MENFIFEPLFLANFSGSFWGVISTTICVLVASFFVDGIKVDGPVSALVAAIVLAIVNFFMYKPMMTILPVGGLIGVLIVNAIVIYIAHMLLDGFKVKNFWAALMLAVAISFLQWLF